MKPPKCLGQYNKENGVCRWLCRIIAYGTYRKCKRSVLSSGNGARALQEEHLAHSGRWHGDYAPPEEHLEHSVQPPLIPRVRGIANLPGERPTEYVPGPADDGADVPNVERGNPMRMPGPQDRPCFGFHDPEATNRRCNRSCSFELDCMREKAQREMREERVRANTSPDMPCFGHYVPGNYACITSCQVQLGCMRATGIANPQRSCLGRFDHFPTDYHDEYCAVCAQVRVCIHQAGIQNALINELHVIAKPAEAPICFGCYYDHVPDNGELACEDMCRFFTDCIRTTHSAINFFQALRLPTDEIDNYQDSAQDSTQERSEQMRSEDFETRQKKARDLEVVPAGDTFLVKSSTRKGGYMVTPEDDGTYHCACMDYATHRGDPEWRCKHIIAVETFLEERGPTSADSRWNIIDIK